jgi:hypothetical protein
MFCRFVMSPRFHAAKTLSGHRAASLKKIANRPAVGPRAKVVERSGAKD